MKPIFKYCPPERLDVLENLKIRFTQPICFNDPLETNVIVKNGITSLPQGVRKSAYDKFQSTTTFTSEKENKTLSRMEKQQWGLNQIKKHFIHNIGILSLSKNFNDPLMWAHYADNCRGFIIGFIPIFNLVEKPYLLVKPCEDVVYVGKPPEIDLGNYFSDDKFYIDSAIEEHAEKFLYFKSDRWVYEKEVRVTTNIPSESSPIEDNGYPVHLVDIYKEQIVLLVSGPHASKLLCQRLIAFSEKLEADYFHAFKPINTYSYGLWDKDTYVYKMKSFGNKEHFGYTHDSEKPRTAS